MALGGSSITLIIDMSIYSSICFNNGSRPAEIAEQFQWQFFNHAVILPVKQQPTLRMRNVMRVGVVVKIAFLTCPKPKFRGGKDDISSMIAVYITREVWIASRVRKAPFSTLLKKGSFID